MEISARKKKILAAVVDEYIRTAEPVGSKTIAETAGLGCSSATIRNELAELTALGYLEQPHTSAGRVPSPKGYRFYVNELMERQKLSVEETEAINARLNEKMEQLDRLMTDAGKLAGQLTGYPALTLSAPRAAAVKRFDLLYVDANTFIIVALLSNNTVKNKLVHLPFSVEQGQIQKLSALFNAGFTGLTEEEITPVLISATERAARDTMGLTSIIAAFTIETLSRSREGAAYVTGESSLLQQPEFRDPDKAHRVISYLSDSEHLLRLPSGGGQGDVRVIIGPENLAEELRDSSVVMASYDAGEGQRGLIGVVGPLRMDYSAVAAKLQYIAEGLSRLLGGGEAPAGFGKMILKGDVKSDEPDE
ncbi:MAG: heat-inducible transcription repressor HrcA [Oscillospiraceae bacterium]|nr:heat-inducible transcription repressor HrcA [Oscillospiraceae bacterium]